MVERGISPELLEKSMKAPYFQRGIIVAQRTLIFREEPRYFVWDWRNDDLIP
jgi:hypothetical protein